MGEILLSICIPTYNRANFLNEAIESIVSQITENMKDKVEICISDNASTDNTDDVIKEWKKKSPIRIVYHKNNKNLGADRNYLKVVEIANGKYCWFLGSDDKLKEGSIKRILNELKEEYDIYLCNRIDCDFNMKPIKKRFWLDRKINKDKVFNLSNREEFLNYLKLANSLGALFSYISSIIFKKESWDLVSFDESFLGTTYSHVYKILSFLKLKSYCKLKYIVDPMVLNRGNNDSFLEKGHINRFMLDINGYLKLANVIFNEDLIVKEKFLKVSLKEHPWYRVLKIIAMCKRDKDYWLDEIESKLISVGYNRNLLALLKFIGTKFEKFVLFLLFVKRNYLTKQGNV